MTSDSFATLPLSALMIALSALPWGCRCDPSPAPVAERNGPGGVGGQARLADAADDDPGPSAIVLVVVDAMRADFMPFLGHTPNTAPFIDAVLADSVIFENAYATSSWTVPSMASIHTGAYPSSHGVVTGDIGLNKGRRSFAQPVLPDTFTTMAEAARGSGYTTIGVAANQHLSAELGFGQGFDHYSPEARFENARFLNRRIERYLEEAFGKAWETEWKRSKMFMWLHYFDPHDPYTTRVPWVRVFAPGYLERPDEYPANMMIKRIKRRFRPDEDYRNKATPLYEAEIAFWDDQLNRLARKMGLWGDDVLLILTSDHGEEFGEHGDMGHGNGLHEEVVRVPLAVRWPKGLKGPRRVAEPVSLVDLYPTVVELAGLERPAGLQGRSLARLLRGEPDDAKSAVFMELHPTRVPAAAWRKGGYKLIRTADDKKKGGCGYELFDLVSDPGERLDIGRKNPKMLDGLRTELEAFSASLPPPPSAELKHIEDELFMQQLINMDYVKDDRPASKGD